MKKELPIYSITKFQSLQTDSDFYANFLKQHVATHHFTKLPHKHDFYLVVLVTAGTGKHEVDFETYKVSRGSVFMMKPGQMHYWKFSDDIDGYVFFHSKEFYDKQFVAASITQFQFYDSLQNPPYLKLKTKPLQKLELLMQAIVEEYTTDELLKWQKLHALINLVYIDLSREYLPENEIKHATYLVKLRKFETLIEANFKTLKFAKDYASKLNMTEKHLNRITKSCIGKTSTQLIGDRVLLEAKRLLMHAEFNVTQIAEELGYYEPSYFVRFFRKNTGVTPLAFLNAYKKA